MIEKPIVPLGTYSQSVAEEFSRSRIEINKLNIYSIRYTFLLTFFFKVFEFNPSCLETKWKKKKKYNKELKTGERNMIRGSCFFLSFFCT